MGEELDAGAKLGQSVATPLPVGLALFAVRSEGEGVDGEDRGRRVECSSVDRFDFSPFGDQSRIGAEHFRIAANGVTHRQLCPET